MNNIKKSTLRDWVGQALPDPPLDPPLDAVVFAVWYQMLLYLI